MSRSSPGHLPFRWAYHPRLTEAERQCSYKRFALVGVSVGLWQGIGGHQRHNCLCQPSVPDALNSHNTGHGTRMVQPLPPTPPHQHCPVPLHRQFLGSRMGRMRTIGPVESTCHVVAFGFACSPPFMPLASDGAAVADGLMGRPWARGGVLPEHAHRTLLPRIAGADVPPQTSHLVCTGLRGCCTGRHVKAGGDTGGKGHGRTGGREQGTGAPEGGAYEDVSRGHKGRRDGQCTGGPEGTVAPPTPPRKTGSSDRPPEGPAGHRDGGAEVAERGVQAALIMCSAVGTHFFKRRGMTAPGRPRERGYRGWRVPKKNKCSRGSAGGLGMALHQK